jgi:hypothetical protein
VPRGIADFHVDLPLRQTPGEILNQQSHYLFDLVKDQRFEQHDIAHPAAGVRQSAFWF